MAAIAEELGHDISCVLLPVGPLGLLLPSACVAEVLPWRRLGEVRDMPAWLLGSLAWRGQSIPVVRFETLNGAVESPPRPGRCIAVMNRCRPDSELAFYGIATDALPRMVQVGEEDAESERTHLGVAETAAVKLGAEHVRIPNLGYIEGLLEEQARRARLARHYT